MMSRRYDDPPGRYPYHFPLLGFLRALCGSALFSSLSPHGAHFSGEARGAVARRGGAGVEGQAGFFPEGRARLEQGPQFHQGMGTVGHGAAVPLGNQALDVLLRAVHLEPDGERVVLQQAEGLGVGVHLQFFTTKACLTFYRRWNPYSSSTHLGNSKRTVLSGSTT